MKSLHKIISDYAKDGTKVEISRRELAKIKAELKRPVHPTVTTRLMNTQRMGHQGKMRWPVVLHREAPKNQGVLIVRKGDGIEHSLIAARRMQYPKTR